MVGAIVIRNDVGFFQMLLTPANPKLPKKLVTVGDHTRFCRIRRKMTKGQVAEVIGGTTDTVTNWKLGRSKPMVRYLPKIITFLGYALKLKLS